MGVVQRLVFSELALDSYGAESPRSGYGGPESDEGRLLSLPRQLLQPLSGCCSYFQHPRFLNGKPRVQNRNGCVSFGDGLVLETATTDTERAAVSFTLPWRAAPGIRGKLVVTGLRLL